MVGMLGIIPSLERISLTHSSSFLQELQCIWYCAFSVAILGVRERTRHTCRHTYYSSFYVHKVRISTDSKENYLSTHKNVELFFFFFFSVKWDFFELALCFLVCLWGFFW